MQMRYPVNAYGGGDSQMKCFLKSWIVMVMVSMVLFQASVAFSQEKDRTGNSKEQNAGLPADWAEIDTLDLKTAAHIALKENPSLKAAAARVQQAKQQVLQARSFYWPTLDATASGSKIWLSDNTYQSNLALAKAIGGASATINDPEEYYRTGLSASWLLFNGFERKFLNASARYGEAASGSALDDARRLLLSAVSSAYYSAQLAMENVAIAKADEAFNQRQLEDAKARRMMGTGSLSDVLNFKVRMNAAKTSRINQEYRYEIEMHSLAALLGIERARFPEHVRLAKMSPEKKTELFTPKVEEMISYAEKNRPDILQTQWTLKQAMAGEKRARGPFYPTLSISGAVEGERTGDIEFQGDDFGSTLQLGLSWNLFSGGYHKAQVNEAKHVITEVEQNLENLMLSVSSEVRNSAAKVVTAQTQVVLQRENVDLVQETRDLVEKEYNAGQGSLVRLNEAQRDLTTAKANLALALVSLRLAWIELETGTARILSLL